MAKVVARVREGFTEAATVAAVEIGQIAKPGLIGNRALARKTRVAQQVMRVLEALAYHELRLCDAFGLKQLMNVTRRDLLPKCDCRHR